MASNKTKAIWILAIAFLLVVVVGSIIWVMMIQTPDDEVECRVDLDCDIGFKCGVEDVFATSEDDCVPRAGCHPNYCINKDFKEDIPGGSFCTTSCSSVLDCGAGECILDNGRCAAQEFSSGDKSYHPDAFKCLEIEGN